MTNLDDLDIDTRNYVFRRICYELECSSFRAERRWPEVVGVVAEHVHEGLAGGVPLEGAWSRHEFGEYRRGNDVASPPRAPRRGHVLAWVHITPGMVTGAFAWRRASSATGFRGYVDVPLAEILSEDGESPVCLCNWPAPPSADDLDERRDLIRYLPVALRAKYADAFLHTLRVVSEAYAPASSGRATRILRTHRPGKSLN